MKKIIVIIVTVLFFSIIAYEAYYYIKHNANTIIVIGNQDENMDEEMMILINDKEISKFRLRNHYSYIHKQYLSFGKNKINLKSVNSNFSFETTISYYGLFSWNYIENNEGKFFYNKYYMSPTFE